ncbi:MAG: RNA 3'-terminal phosphate cyclase [Methanomicrobiales archaeon]|nr:RNA 3'-terminal phosphate cyclase [Methanomicrobiales archaeon]
MLRIDGSLLEGGGQIVRSAVALSAVTGTPVEIISVREKRARPGLANQHCAAVRAVAETCDARVAGNTPGSSRLSFVPRSIVRRNTAVDVGTAGSIPLVIQAWLPVALEKGGSLMVQGGTEVQFSPTIDYFTEVFVPALGPAGEGIRVEVIRRGYYPVGGGMVRVSVEPASCPRISAGSAAGNGIRSCSSNLPGHVADRQAARARAYLLEETGEEYPVSIRRSEGPGTGSSCTVWSGAKGSCALGKRGLPAEKVGEAAASGLVAALRATGEVDLHMSDQLLLYLARGGGSYTAPEFTLHARTMCWLLSLFGMPVKVSGRDPVEFRA